MENIHHHIVIESTPEKLFQAITSSEGLSSWWTKAEATQEIGENLSFFFGPQCDHKMEMELISLEANRKVVWQCVEEYGQKWDISLLSLKKPIEVQR